MPRKRKKPLPPITGTMHVVDKSDGFGRPPSKEEPKEKANDD